MAFFLATFDSPGGLISSSGFKIFVDGNQVTTWSCYQNWPGMDKKVYSPVNNINRPTIIGNCIGTYFNALKFGFVIVGKLNYLW